MRDRVPSGGTGAAPVEDQAILISGGKASSDGMTFACRDQSAMAKCLEHAKYRWWESSDDDVRHQACVRMLRADYCGDGVAHTVNGTVLDVEDVAGESVAETSRDSTAFGPTSMKIRTPAAYIASTSSTNRTGSASCRATVSRIASGSAGYGDAVVFAKTSTAGRASSTSSR